MADAAVEEQAKNAVCTVKPKEFVVCQINEGRTVLLNIPLAGHAKQKIGKAQVEIARLSGLQFGRLYEIEKDGSIVHSPEDHELEAISEESLEAGKADEGGMPTTDNRKIVDDNSAQALSEEEIHAMKQEQGGRYLVDQLVKSSVTFEKKTDFSKIKYLKKKQRKHLSRLRLLQPSPYLLCESQFNDNYNKPNSLRPDYLGVILSFSGVQSGMKVVVFETLRGLITASLAWRMKGSGYILSVYPDGGKVNRDFERFLNLSAEEKGTIEYMSSTTLKNTIQQLASGTVPEEVGTGRHQPSAVAVDAIATGFDSCVAAGNVQALDVARFLFPIVIPGSPFVVYSIHTHDLAEAQPELVQSGRAFAVSYKTSDLRKFQVLKNRTHPEMDTKACGGALMSGVVSFQPSEDDKNTLATLNFDAASKAVADWNEKRNSEAEGEAEGEAGAGEGSEGMKVASDGDIKRKRQDEEKQADGQQAEPATKKVCSDGVNEPLCTKSSGEAGGSQK